MFNLVQSNIWLSVEISCCLKRGHPFLSFFDCSSHWWAVHKAWVSKDREQGLSTGQSQMCVNIDKNCRNVSYKYRAPDAILRHRVSTITTSLHGLVPSYLFSFNLRHVPHPLPVPATWACYNSFGLKCSPRLKAFECAIP